MCVYVFGIRGSLVASVFQSRDTGGADETAANKHTHQVPVIQ